MNWVIDNPYEQPGPWFGGKPLGLISDWRPIQNAFHLKLSSHKISETFSFAEYGSEENARAAAKKFRFEVNLNAGLLRNRVRMLSDDVVEMQLTQGHTQIFDYQDLPVLKKHIWCASKPRKGYINAKTGSKVVHQLLFGHEMDHINDANDTYGLDNRRVNLRLGGAKVRNNNHRLRSTNTSGVNGVTFGKVNRRWTASWFEDGERKRESFTTKQMAINCRKAADLKTGCTNGKRQKRS